MARKTVNKASRSRTRKSLSIVDPRLGDIEDDASSTKRRSMLSLFGSMLVEISFPKLIFAWMLLLVVPGLLLGLAPIVFIEWLTLVTDKLASLAIGFWSLLLLAILIGVGWFGWRSMFRIVENNFWTLNSIVVEPGYAAFREAFRQMAERLFARHASDAQRGCAQPRRQSPESSFAGSPFSCFGLSGRTPISSAAFRRSTPGRKSEWSLSPTASSSSPPIWALPL